VFSTRWLFTASAAGFIATSLLCAMAWDIQSMIVFRALQGLLGASMIPTVFTSSFHYFQGPRRVYSAAVIGTIASVAPTLGPVIGGWITDALNWHWLFYINLIPGLAVTILVPLLVDIDEPDPSLLAEAAYLGIVLLAIGLGSLEYVLEEGSRWNWFDDATIETFAFVAAVAGALFVIRALLSARRSPTSSVLIAISRFAAAFVHHGSGHLLRHLPDAAVSGYVRGYSATAGVAIFSTGVASLIGVPVYIALARRFDTRWLMMFGMASFGLAMWSYSFLTHEWGGAEFLLPQILRGFPQVFVVAPAVNLGLGSLSPDRLKYASGLFNMMRNLGGAVGIAVCSAILNDRTNFHFLTIASNLTPANGAMNELIGGMSQRYEATLGNAVAAHGAALQQLWNLAYREASTMAYADAFRAILIVFVVATALVPLMRNVTTSSSPANAGH
jgi:DHA2 family multidrug resistance protein